MSEITPLRISRRRFLDLGCKGIGSVTLFSSLSQLVAASAASGTQLTGVDDPDDYKALVCILLAGGNDSFNMLVPRDPAGHAEYAGVRGDLALARESLVELPGSLPDGRQLGLHAEMDDAARLYREEKLAFLANVGTLVEPITLAEYEAQTRGIPLGLFSHSDQITQWQTSLPDTRSATGWGGRIADLIGDAAGDTRISMSISLAGSNAFQTGETTTEYAITPQGSVGIRGYGEDGFFPELRNDAIESMISAEYRSIFERTYAARLRNAIDANERFAEALAAATAVETPFGPGPLSASLRMVARTIAARTVLGMRRQTFFVLVGGWDHHDDTLVNQAQMLPGVSRALGAFYAATVELGVADKVTTFSISDFGRTLTSNGRGSDHGWGGNQIVMGGAVAGGQIVGTYPQLAAGNPLDTGRGRLIPTLSVDEYFAELALWFGVSPGDLAVVLPNLHRFYAAGSGLPPLGFLGA